jgi:hypothetical protein
VDIRPQDLPELRVELLAYHSDPRRLRRWEQLIASGDRDWMEAVRGEPPRPGDGVIMQAHERMRVEQAQLYYVSPEMTELVSTAGRSLPDFNIEPEDMPSPEGMIAFGSSLHTGLTSPAFAAGQTVGIAAIVWSLLHGANGGLWLSFYATRSEVADALPNDSGESLVAGQHLIYLFGTEAAWGFRVGDTAAPEPDSHLDVAGRALKSAWLLMQQPLAECSEVGADRAARKRLRRAGQEPKSVRVVDLRRPKHTGTSNGESGREYHHQWIVRGHWRQQWYPAREVHRPVWIAPHVKGPDGAPLIGGEKVYALKR